MEPASSPNPHILERLMSIIRRDLMLGNEVRIEAETRLFGGEWDLDSLDALLLMQSLEKEFGFKLPSEAFGPQVFASVASLARFVQEQVVEAGQAHRA